MYEQPSSLSSAIADLINGICPDGLIYGDGDWWITLDGAQVDAFYRSALQQGLEYHRSKCRGDLPGNLLEEIYALSRPPIHWDVELVKWFDEQFEPIEKHRTYARMNRRQSATPDIPRPACRMEGEAVEQRICSGVSFANRPCSMEVL